ncbi:MAG: alpha/beta fold hydrolase [Thermodesulfobacteriota bacterium]
MEEAVFFKCGDIRLSGLMHRGNRDRAAVITHPHPLYGGDMHNFVVETVSRACWSAGYSTLRFNFRGTGQSQGEYSGGVEEQDDVAAAVSYLTETGCSQIDLAGYSFGAWVCALGAHKYGKINRMVLVSPPVAFVDFKGIASLPSLAAVVTGSDDEFAPPDIIRAMIPAWNPGARFHVIDGADHFYFGYDRELEKIIKEALR